MRWGIDLNAQTVALIVEVKTGGNNKKYRQNIKESFDLGRLIYCIQRLGLCPRDLAQEIADQLSNAAIHIYNERNFVVGIMNMPRDDQIPLCMKPKLEEAEGFILERLCKYKEKGSDRLRFPSDLMQYLTWSRMVCKKTEAQQERDPTDRSTQRRRD